jgi:type II pantothenate kinase
MIAINTAQIVYLNAKLHGVDQVFFAGGFIQDAPDVKKYLEWGITFWSGGTMKV